MALSRRFLTTAAALMIGASYPLSLTAQQADGGTDGFEEVFVDENGNPVDAQGNPIEGDFEWVDENGNVINDGGNGGVATAPQPATPQPATPQPATPQPTAPASTAGGGVAVDVQGLLAAHNRLRARHGVPPLTWSTALQQASQAWSNTCSADHSTTNNGENLSGWTGGGVSQASRVDDWYSEIQFYDFANRPVPYVDSPDPAKATGHFTQVVWRNTTQVGCGIAKCPGDIENRLTCQYSPAGNFVGDHAANVPPPN